MRTDNRWGAALRELPGRYWRVIVLLVAFGVVNFPDALILLRLKEIGFSVAEVILAYVGYNMVYALGSYPAGSLADRIPKPTVFGIGMVFSRFATSGSDSQPTKSRRGSSSGCMDCSPHAPTASERHGSPDSFPPSCSRARKAYFRARRASRFCRQVCGPVCCGGQEANCRY